MALWGAVLGGGNLVYHAAGWQEGGLTASFEKLVIDVEMLQHMIEFLRPIEVNEDELGARGASGAVPTGGHFFGEPHTLERYETAFYQPMLSNWQNYEAWQEAGGHDATARATRLWKKALEEYRRAGDGSRHPRSAGGLCRQAQGSDRGGRAVRQIRREISPIHVLIHSGSHPDSANPLNPLKQRENRRIQARFTFSPCGARRAGGGP